jgi:hypothetical protein
MIYGCGSIEKNRLHDEKKKDENVYFARMNDIEGSYRLLVSAVSDATRRILQDQDGWFLHCFYWLI